MRFSRFFSRYHACNYKKLVSNSHYCFSCILHNFIFNGRTEKTLFKSNEAEKFHSAQSFWFAQYWGTSSLQINKYIYFSHLIVSFMFWRTSIS